MHEADDAFDAIILVMVLAIFTPIMIYCAMPFFKGDVGGFGVLIEKSAPATENEVIFNEVDSQLTTDDIMLMLVIADVNTPMPQKIRIDTAAHPVEIPIDEDFFYDRVLKLNVAKAAMPVTENVELELYSGPAKHGDWSGLSGMRFWNVKFKN